MTTIKLTRPFRYWDAVYNLKVYVDGTRVGKLKGGQTLSLNIPLGSKLLYGKMGWAKTRTFSLSSLKDGTHLKFEALATGNPLILTGITGYPLEINLEDES